MAGAELGLPADSQLQDWWSDFAHGGLRSTLHSDDVTRNPLRVSCAGSVLEGDAEVGQWQRSAVLDAEDALRVEHLELMLDDPVQERGFGRAWYQHCEMLYQADGVRWVDVHAEQVGAYVWASCGFEFVVSGPPEDALRQRARAASALLNEQQDALQEVIDESPLTESDCEAFLARFADVEWLHQIGPVGAGAEDLTNLLAGYFTSPGEIAEYGRGQAWKQGCREVWLGREFLIGSSWLGRKTLG